MRIFRRVLLDFQRLLGSGYLIVLILILAEVVWLFWQFDYLPMTDLPEHMFQATVLTHYHEPGKNFAEFFTRRFPWNPYSSYFWFVCALSPIIDVIPATRLYLSLAFVFTILTYALWLREAAPSRVAQIIPSTLFLFGFFYYLGAVNFLFSIPFLFMAMTAAARICAVVKPDRKLEFWLGLALLGAYFSHVFTFVLAILVTGFQCGILFRGRNFISILRGYALPLTIGGIYLISQAAGDVVALHWAFEPLGMRIEKLLLPFGFFRDELTNRWIFHPEMAVIWALVLALACVGIRFRKPAFPYPNAVWISLLFVGATVALPSFVSNGMPFAMRAAYPAAFCMLALLPADWKQIRYRRIAIYVLCAASPLILSCRLMLFQREAQGLQEVISAIPAGRVLQPVITEPHSRYFSTYPYLHAAAWSNMVRGGTSPYLFSSQPHFPVREKISPILNPPGEWQMEQFQYRTHQAGTEYFLVKTQSADILSDLDRHVPLLAQSGEWRVYGPNGSTR